MMKPRLSLAAILSTAAIASGVLLGSVTPAKSCMPIKSTYRQERYEQANWLRTPLAAVLTLPGIAIATALSLGYRHYKG
jgi:hypothetical protein